jgi:hypothetical protein
MTVAPRVPEQDWTADGFLETDQHEFGNAWRYQLVGGRIVAYAAPSPEHGAILAGLTGALGSRLRGNPDAMIRCGKHPRVLFEDISTFRIAQLDRTRRAAA